MPAEPLCYWLSAVLASPISNLITISLLIVLWKNGPLKPKLSIEAVTCKHSLRNDEAAFLLLVNLQLHNRGNKKTTITGLETHFVDAQNRLQSQTLTLNLDVGTGVQATPVKVLFSFAPPFPTSEKLKVHFILYHTYGREVFVADSARSDMQTQV